jgi:hypothetical protein
MGGRLLRSRSKDRRNNPDLTVGRTLGGDTVGPSSRSHASCLAAASHSSRPSIGIS